MPVASILSELTEALTTVVGDYGLYAVFVLMFVDAILPAACEPVMVFGGALASGAFAAEVTVFGADLPDGFWSWFAIGLAGTVGYVLGSIRRLGDRLLRRPAVRRATRALAARDPGEARQGRALVRALGRLVRRRRPRHAGAPLVRGDPGRGARMPLGRYTLADDSRVGRSGASASPGSAGRSAPTGSASTTRSTTSTTSCSALLARRRRLCSGCGGAPLDWLAVPPPIPLVDVKAQYAPLIPRLQAAFAEVLESGTFILGPNVKAFEEEAAAYLGVPETIGVANGTDALVLVLDALGIGPGDEVICPAFTFYATAESIARRGATPVFAEIDPPTLNLDPQDVADRITPRTKAIMPVHLFGRPAPLDELASLGPALVEDAAQAFGAPGDRRHRDRLDLQLLPDEEPVRARRRRPRRVHRRGARGARPHAPLPRLAGEGRLRVRRLQLAPRRGPGGRAADLPAGARGLEPGAARGGRRATASSSATSSRRPPTSRATSTTCSSAARRSATASSSRCAPPGSARTSTTCPRSISSRRCATSAGPTATSPRPSAPRPRTSRSRSGPGSRPSSRSAWPASSARPSAPGCKRTACGDRAPPAAAARRRRGARRRRLVPRVPAPLRSASTSPSTTRTTCRGRRSRSSSR